MFSGCTNLVIPPPELPALNVSIEGYYGMFENCVSLTLPPIIKATYINHRGLTNMFNGCTSLLESTELNLNFVGSGGLARMFNGCSSLIIAKQISVANYDDSKFEEYNRLLSMFENCSSLVNGPILSLDFETNYGDFSWIFKNCNQLNTIYLKVNDNFNIHPTGMTENNWNAGWLSGVGPNGTIYVTGELTDEEIGELPNGWKIVRQNDEQPRRTANYNNKI